MPSKTAPKGPTRPGKAQEAATVTIYLPDKDIPLPGKEDVLRVAYARAIDDDERGDIRVKAAELCYKMLRDEDQSSSSHPVIIIDDIPDSRDDT